ALALPPALVEQRVDCPRPAVEELDPAEPGKAVGQRLCPVRSLQFGEGVVVLHEADTGRVELSGEPVVAVDVGLSGGGERGLDTDTGLLQRLVRRCCFTMQRLRPCYQARSRCPTPAQTAPTRSTGGSGPDTPHAPRCRMPGYLGSQGTSGSAAAGGRARTSPG